MTHAITLVANPVRLHEVVGPARAGEGKGAQDEGDLELAGGLAEVGDRIAGVAPLRGADGGEHSDDQEEQNGAIFTNWIDSSVW